MNLLMYLIKTILISGLLMGYFFLFLRNHPFHTFNRWYLLAVPFVSLLLPALALNLPALWNQTGAGAPIHLLGVGRGKLEEAVSIYSGYRSGTGIDWGLVALGINTIVALVLISGLLRTISYLRALRKGKKSLKLREAIVFFVSEKGTPFSFFRSIFWGQEMDVETEAGQTILRHEIFHVREQHSLDILITEIMSILCWFNPFFHQIRSELKAIHEYAADRHAAADGDTYAYANLLLMNSSATSHSITHPFFKNQIKRRISMMTKTKTSSGLLGRFMILPLLAILISLFSFKFSDRLKMLAEKPILVVIDAGHGGSYSGSTYNGLNEKDINLSIAQNIQRLAKEYNVQVFMTREKDENSGSADLESSLIYRSELPAAKHADLFISIHTNGTLLQNGATSQDRYSGFEIYVPKNSSRVYDGSVKLASSISDFIKNDFTIAAQLKQRDEHILVLDKATVPAILIECGYLDNKSDARYLEDKSTQEKIARDILEGIRKFGVPLTGYSPVPMPVSTDVAVISSELNRLPTDSSGPLKKVDVEASYPGGQIGWTAYLQKNLKYPSTAVKKEIQGKVDVEFVVKKNGSLSDIRAISGPSELQDAAVLALKNSGKWIPAKNNQVVVESYHIQPIIYKLSAG